MGRRAAAFLQKHLDDILFVSGAGVVVYATWLLSVVAALYVLGGLLIVGSVLVGVSRRGS
jgi:hypothetical protein